MVNKIKPFFKKVGSFFIATCDKLVANAKAAGLYHCTTAAITVSLLVLILVIGLSMPYEMGQGIPQSIHVNETGEKVVAYLDSGSEASVSVEVKKQALFMSYSAPELTSYAPMSFGITRDSVEILQIKLSELGYLNIDETTTYYGPATQRAVMAFQRQIDLPKTGDADSDTLRALFSNSAPEYQVMKGSSGDDVSFLQQQLFDMSYIDSITGFYGDKTVAAIKAFQQRNNLEVTGNADIETVSLLYMPDAIPSVAYEKKERRRIKIKEFIAVAEKQLGKRYISGNRGPNSFDCSGLVAYCLSQAGSNRSRLSADGYSHVTEWEKISSMNDLQIGDLMFFFNYGRKGRVGHVGIYVGGGYMIDASSSAGKVVKRSCLTSYWKRNFVFARRPW